MRYLLFVLLLSSCGPAYHIRKAEQKGGKITTDTVYERIKVVVPMVQTDTVFKSVPGVPVTITKDRLQFKIVRLPGDSIFVEGKCLPDTLRIEVPVTVTKTIQAGQTVFQVIKWCLFALVVGFLVGMLFQSRR